MPTGTNVFDRHFPEAKALADQIEKRMVPVSFVLSNVPHTPDAEIKAPIK